jgi:hypothetical protein
VLTPVTRRGASPTLKSGNCPMLSAATESTMVGAACLVAMARVFCDWNELRICTASRVGASASTGDSAAMAYEGSQPTEASPSASG